MNVDPEQIKKLIDQKESLEQEVHKLEQKKLALETSELLELKERKKQERLDTKRERQERKEAVKRESKKSREHDLADVYNFWDELFGIDCYGRKFLHRLGSFAFRGFLVFAISSWVMLFGVTALFSGQPQEGLYRSIGRVICFLITMYYGRKGWRGETKLSAENQYLIGIVTLICAGILAISVVQGWGLLEWLNTENKDR